MCDPERFYDLVCPICGKKQFGALFYLVSEIVGDDEYLVCHAQCRGERKRVEWVGASMFGREIQQLKKKYPGVRIQTDEGWDPGEPDPPNFHRMDESPAESLYRSAYTKLKAIEDWARKPTGAPVKSVEWQTITAAKKHVLELLGFDTGPGIGEEENFLTGR